MRKVLRAATAGVVFGFGVFLLSLTGWDAFDYSQWSDAHVAFGVGLAFFFGLLEEGSQR